MTKLMEWLFCLNFFFAIYFIIVTEQIKSAFFDKWMFEIIISPIVLLGTFGVYSVLTILYRVITFNNCEEAAREIQEQIKEARSDLQAKGFSFEEAKKSL